jgi:hypothetical protein
MCVHLLIIMGVRHITRGQDLVLCATAAAAAAATAAATATDVVVAAATNIAATGVAASAVWAATASILDRTHRSVPLPTIAISAVSNASAPALLMVPIVIVCTPLAIILAILSWR